MGVDRVFVLSKIMNIYKYLFTVFCIISLVKLKPIVALCICDIKMLNIYNIFVV